MRHYLLGAAVAAVAALTSSLAHADDQQIAIQNEQIARQIAQNLSSSGQLKGYRVDVGYRDGVATIGGRVSSAQQRAIALEIARRSANVAEVVDELAIAPVASRRVKLVAIGDAQPNVSARSGLARIKTGLARITTIHKPGSVKTSARRAQPLGQSGDAVTRTAAISRQHPTQQQLAAQQQWAYQQQMAMQTAMRQQQMAAIGATPVGYALAAPLAAPVALARRAALGQPMPAAMPGGGGRVMPASYDQPNLPNYAWPAYAPYNNYSRVTYPKQYSPTAWPFIGPFYPYPQVPLGWRKVTLEWDDGWWRLKFRHHRW